MSVPEPSVDRVALWPGAAPSGHQGDETQPFLQPFLADADEPRGAVLVVPGGGYRFVSWEKEGVQAARRFNDEGWHAFVLSYRVRPHRHPAPLLDVRRAMRIVRHHADQWGVISNRVAACGFSAGGHLVGSLALLEELEGPPCGDAIDGEETRPDALVLCYPVVTAGEHADAAAIENLLGPGASPELLRTISLQKHVSEKMPPSFIWHTANDTVVPVMNSLLLAKACSTSEVPFELHIYPEGRHGMGLAVRPAREDPHVATWMPLCCEWLRGLGW